MRALLAASWQAERDRWLLWVPVLLTAGAIAYLAAPQEPVAYLAGPLAALCLLAGIGVRRRAPGLFIPLVACAAWGAGFQLAQHRAMTVAPPILERPTGRVEVAGAVRRIERREARARLLIVLDGGHSSAKIAHLRSVRLSMPLTHAEPIVAGMSLSVPAILRPPSRPTHPAGFDFRRWAWFQGFSATGYTVGTPMLGSESESPGFAILLARLREAINKRIRAALPGETGDVAVALTTGDRSGLSEDTLKAMRDSGLAHLLAISGLHLGLVAMTVFFSVRFCLVLGEGIALRQPVKKIAAVVALVIAFLYLLISGGAVPTVRAFLMTGVLLIAVLVDRQALSMRSVALAAAAIVVLYPEATVGASFQLSFAAVIALVAAYEAAGSAWFGADRTGFGARILRYAAGVLATTVIASSATMPVALFHFGRIATLGVISNLVAVPLMAFLVMPAALVALLFMPFGLEGPFLAVMGIGIDAVLWIAGAVAGWDFAHLSAGGLSPIGFGIVSAGGLWLALWRTRWRFWGLGGIALGLAIGFVSDDPDLFVSEEAKVVLFRSTDGAVTMSPGAGGRFIRDGWRTALGAPEIRPWPGPSGRCDGFGCAFRHGDTRIAVTWDSRSIPEDCRRADVLISAVPVSDRWCAGPDAVIDFFDLRRGGSHTVTFRGHSAPRIRMVDPPGRSRLWAPDPWEDRRRTGQ